MAARPPPEPIAMPEPEPALHHIVYRSEAVPPVTAGTLEALLTVSRGNNRRAGITGLLIYTPDRYMQCLEGPPAAVQEMLGRIRVDVRHRDLELLLDEPVAARSFARWDMACSAITASWAVELARAEWKSHAASAGADLPPSQGLMMMQSAWYEFGEGFEGSLH